MKDKIYGMTDDGRLIVKCGRCQELCAIPNEPDEPNICNDCLRKPVCALST